jgi:uncharacterized protein YjbI with pentapeptide repeats
MKFEIKNWITGKVMFTLEGADWKLAFVAAVKAGQEFKEADLTEKDFSGIKLTGGVFYNSSFDNSSFYNSSFDNSRFYNSSFDNSSFYNSSFYNSSFDNSRFYNSSFYNSSFDNSRLDNSSFDNSSFYNSSFDGLKISKTPRPFLFISPLGADQHQLMAVSTVKGIRLKTGCFSGSVPEFIAALKKKHGDNDVAKEYQAALALIELHFKLWVK